MATRKKMTAARGAAALAQATASEAPTETKGARSGYQVNLSDDERDLIDTEAGEAGLERSTLMRMGSLTLAQRLRRERLGQAGGGA